MYYVRLPLEGTANTRDLGGYPTTYKTMTKWHKALRSDCMSQLTENDISILLNDYNVKVIIDLRSEAEIEQAPNKLASNENINYYNVSLSNKVNPNEIKDILNNGGELFFDIFYMDLLNNGQEGLKQTLDILLNVKDSECVIFHCTAGKDRTGIIAMLLLGICGVTRQDIATNYMVTETNLQYSKLYMDNYEKSMKPFIEMFGLETVNKFSGSKVESIERTYDSFIEKYESFDNYFKILGYNDDQILKFRQIYSQ